MNLVICIQTLDPSIYFVCSQGHDSWVASNFRKNIFFFLVSSLHTKAAYLPTKYVGHIEIIGIFPISPQLIYYSKKKGNVCGKRGKRRRRRTSSLIKVLRASVALVESNYKIKLIHKLIMHELIKLCTRSAESVRGAQSASGPPAYLFMLKARHLRP